MSAPTHELTFGNVDNLPGADILNDFHFDEHLLDASKSSFIALHPDHPEIVVRHQAVPHYKPDTYISLAKLGLKHYAVMDSLGTQIPAQRFVLGPERFDTPNTYSLYSITERISGRDLTILPEDGEHSANTIDKISGYILWILDNLRQDEEFFSDTASPRQHSLADGQLPNFAADTVIWHDGGLTLRPVSHPTWGVLRSVSDLTGWAGLASIGHPPNLAKLCQKVGMR